MSFDAHKNFARSTVATAPSPAISGTTLSVQAGHGARFPAAPFNIVVFSDGIEDEEILRVTDKGTGDNWTVIRAQESTSGRTIIVGDRVWGGITVKTFTDIEAAITSSQQIFQDATGSPPPDPTKPAISYPTGGGGITVWDVDSQAWV